MGGAPAPQPGDDAGLLSLRHVRPAAPRSGVRQARLSGAAGGEAVSDSKDAPTPEQLMQTARVRYEEFVQSRDRMVERKNTEGALGYCYAKANLDSARAVIPKPKLVTP